MDQIKSLYENINEGLQALELLDIEIDKLHNHVDAVNDVMDKFYNELKVLQHDFCGKEKCAYECDNSEHCHNLAHRTDETKNDKYCCVELIKN